MKNTIGKNQKADLEKKIEIDMVVAILRQMSHGYKSRIFIDIIIYRIMLQFHSTSNRVHQALTPAFIRF